MSIKARYSGTCPECGERWQPGDLIYYGGTGGQHARCPDAPDPLPAARAGEVNCTNCWLIHPEGSCDR